MAHVLTHLAVTSTIALIAFGLGWCLGFLDGVTFDGDEQ